MKRLLEHDWSDKQEAFQLDHFAAKLANDRVKAQFKVTGGSVVVVVIVVGVLRGGGGGGGGGVFVAKVVSSIYVCN